jgi:hypothetical protein
LANYDSSTSKLAWRQYYRRELSFKPFREGIEARSNYSQAYACLGFAHIFDYRNRWTDDPDGSLH